MEQDKQPAIVQVRPISAEDETLLAQLFAGIEADPTQRYFHPHPFTSEMARRIAKYDGKDLYVLALLADIPVAYGLLRGWDEGYTVPSLGIYVTPWARGTGTARRMMDTLHALARDAGAMRIRLKVHEGNIAAFRLYESLGYVFEAKEAGQRVGYLDLPN